MPDQREQRKAQARGGGRPRGRGAHAGPPADEGPELLLGLGGLNPPGGDADGPDQAPIGAAALAVRLRPRTVRARVVALLALPVVSLLALWGLAAVTTAQSTDQLTRAGRTDARLLGPLDAAITALQSERLAAGTYAAAPSGSRAQQLRSRESATDGAAGSLRIALTAAGSDASAVSAGLPGRITALDSGLGRLAGVRHGVTPGQPGHAAPHPGPGAWRPAVTAYGDLVDQALSVQSALAAGRPALASLARAQELLAREDTAVRSAQAAGRLTADEYQLLDGAAYARAHPEADDPPAGPVDAADSVDPADARAVAAAEAAVRGSAPSGSTGSAPSGSTGSGAGARLLAGSDVAGWSDAAGGLRSGLHARASAQRSALTAADATPYRTALFRPAGIAVLLGLLAVCASLLVSVRIGRVLVVELVALRNSALDLAFRRLPNALRRLRAGEEVDLDAETAQARPAGVAGRGEVGEVGDALGLVQRAALQAAVERAEVMSGVSGVFVNLARRSQVLLHRQLRQLDAMERRTEDPAELSDLFRLDHLTTRMRRHAESLIILSGASPGRGWRRPVPLLDVARAAVAEVEDYARVEIRRLADARLTGGAVADITHLLAELVENATAFSPPHTPVTVSGDRVGAGYAVEVEDRGLGMGAEALASANRRVAESRPGDFFDGDRLGLYVVSRLAHRNGLDVSLRRSPYGGITAVVLIPSGLLAAPGELAAGGQGRGGQGRGGRVPGARPGAPTVEWGTAEAAAGEPDLPPSGVRPGGPIASARQLTALPGGRPGEDGESSAGAPAGSSTSGTAQVVDASSDDPEASTFPLDDPVPLDELRPPPTGGDQLPRRVRQASLVPELREEPEADEEPPADALEPDEARATMSALQRGWTLGRLDDPGGGPGGGAGPEQEQEQEQDGARHAAQQADGAARAMAPRRKGRGPA